jgi:hypothetical protein
MVLFHNRHASNVAVDLFAEPPSEWDGIAELGLNPLATCSTPTTGAFVPQQRKHLNKQRISRMVKEDRSLALPTLPRSKNSLASLRIR